MTNYPKFQFSNVVVVDGDNIGVILKTWNKNGFYNYDVYVRYSSEVKNYSEQDIRHFIYSKDLHEHELDYYT